MSLLSHCARGHHLFLVIRISNFKDRSSYIYSYREHRDISMYRVTEVEISIRFRRWRYVEIFLCFGFGLNEHTEDSSTGFWLCTPTNLFNFRLTHHTCVEFKREYERFQTFCVSQERDRESAVGVFERSLFEIQTEIYTRKYANFYVKSDTGSWGAKPKTNRRPSKWWRKEEENCKSLRHAASDSFETIRRTETSQNWSIRRINEREITHRTHICT